MSFTVELLSSKSEIDKFRKRVRDVQKPLTSFLKYKRELINNQFETFTDPDGKPWQPLKESTKRRKKINADKILTHKGLMRRSLETEVNQNSFRIWFTSPYARYHQTGTRKMSQRRILGFTEKDRTKLKKLITVFVTAKG